MQTFKCNTLKLSAALLVVVGLLGGFSTQVASAQTACSPVTVTRDLYARTSTMQLGSTTVAIWGYADNSVGTVALPGPMIDVSAGSCVQVTLHNVDIPEATSLLFQGQDMVPDTTGTVAGASKSYVFAASSPGTFLYEAGLTPNGQHQVAMGLYGALIVRPAVAGQAYENPGSAYDKEAVLVLGELDTALNGNAAPAAFDMRNFSPKYFLINGRAYPETGALAADAGQKLLIRYVNAGLQAHAMSTLGVSQTVIAQDGSFNTYPRTVVAESIASGQTLDAIVTVPASAAQGNRFAVYDANMLLRNNTAPGFGGMLAFLAVGPAPPPPTDPGPAVTSLSLSPHPTNGSVNVTVNATITDSGTNASNIQAAEFYVDGTANPANAMAPLGALDSPSEAFAGTIASATLATLASGNHAIYVRGQDAVGNWGPFLSVVLNLDRTGPVTSGLSLAPNPSSGSQSVALTAAGNDTATGNSNVTAAEFWVDAGPHTAMTIVAATAAPIRSFTATIQPPLSMGTHTVSVRSQDALMNWGAVATIGLQVADTAAPVTSNVTASPNPNNGSIPYNTSVPAVRVTAAFSDAASGGSNIVAAEGFMDQVAATGTGFVFVAADGSFNSASESGYSDIPLASIKALTDGQHTIYVHSKDASGNWGNPNLATTILTIDKTGPTFGPITVSPASVLRANNASVTVTVSGSITSLSDLNFSSGTYTMTDSKSATVVSGTYSIGQNGSFSFSRTISRSIGSPGNTPRIYTFTISAADKLGNPGKTTAQFTVRVQ